MRLYELQQELRRLSYFDIWRRMQLSITICKVLLQLPIMINTASREKRQQKTIQDAGILGMRVENALKLAVGLLEAGERYTTWWWSNTLYIYTHTCSWFLKDIASLLCLYPFPPPLFPPTLFFTITSNELHNIRFAIIPWLSLLYVPSSCLSYNRHVSKWTLSSSHMIPADTCRPRWGLLLLSVLTIPFIIMWKLRHKMICHFPICLIMETMCTDTHHVLISFSLWIASLMENQKKS